MNTPIQVGPHKFTSKSAAKQHARGIMKRHAEIGIMTPGDEMFLRDLIALHPESEQKIGCGILGFTTQVDPVWKTTRHFAIIRTDGSITDFSFHTCLDGNNHRKDVLQALRHAVADQVLTFLNREFETQDKIFCPFTGIQLVPFECHVDHIPPDTFLNLVSRWMTENSIDYSEIKLVENADNQWVRELLNQEQIASWQRFHILNCHLRLVSKIANLSHVKRGMEKLWVGANNDLNSIHPTSAQA